MDRWSGKVAVVTGASAGIGAGIVQELVKNGMIVVGLARRSEKVEELKIGLTNAPGKLHALKCDVAKENEIFEAFDWVKKNLGTIHVLVNNAGVLRYCRLADGDPNLWREVFDVNVMGLSICTQQAFKLMKETGVDDGHIIHINSIAGHRVPVSSEPKLNVYHASKHAVTALTETLRQELRYLKTKIKITSISPGFVDTEIVDACVLASNFKLSEERRKMINESPKLKPKDIADAVIYVLSTPPHVQVHELIIKPVGEES